MRHTTGIRKSPGEKIVKDIKRATRKQYASEEKIRIVLDGLRGEDSIAAPALPIQNIGDPLAVSTMNVFVRRLNNIDHSKRRGEVFYDFRELAYCSLAKKDCPDTQQQGKLEAQHMGVVARIGCQVLTQAFATTTDIA